jgi:hypothetical protein
MIRNQTLSPKRDGSTTLSVSNTNILCKIKCGTLGKNTFPAQNLAIAFTRKDSGGMIRKFPDQCFSDV